MRRLFQFFAAFIVSISPLLAQQPSTPADSSRKVSARTDLVLVPVLVTDKSGNPVAGLGKGAFRLEENGKLRVLSLFEETQTQKLTVFPAASSPDTHANFLPNDERLRITIFVIDMLNTPWLRQVEGKKQLTDFLLRITSQDEPMALFGLNSSGLRQLHSFTTDPKVLVLALQKLKLSLSSEESTQPPATLTDDPYFDPQATDEEQIMSDMLQDLNDTVAANYQRMATRQTLAAMTQIARAVESLPVRKTLIWATAGFPFTLDDPASFARQGDDLRPEFEEAWRSLNAANIAVYPVDLGSVDFTPKALPSANSTVSKTQIAKMRGTNGNGLSSPLNLPYDQGVQQRLTMHAFADATGGRACVTISEIEKCFAEAVDDSRAYYLLGYYLDNAQPGWHKLKLKVAGDYLRVRYRDGFYVAPKLPDTSEQRRQELVDALASVVQYTGIRLTARLVSPATDSMAGAAGAPPPSSPATKSAEFMLGIMGDSIAIDREKGNSVDLQITTLAFDSNRKSVATSSQAVTTGFKPEMLPKILQAGLGIPEKIDLPPGKYEVKFAVRDNQTGRIGTISLPLDLK